MVRVKFTDDYTVAYIATWEIAEGEWEPPVWSLSVFDSEDHGHTVREFDHYPDEEEVQTALAVFRKVRR